MVYKRIFRCVLDEVNVVADDAIPSLTHNNATLLSMARKAANNILPYFICSMSRRSPYYDDDDDDAADADDAT